MMYDGIVVASNLNDPRKSGSVRARIIGISDGLDDNMQPWVQPSVNTEAKVPSPGTFLKIYFKNNGDQSFPVYLLQGISGGDYLPSEYRADYPNITSNDMGMYYIYNESSHEYVEIDKITGYSRTILPDGSTLITTPGGFSYTSDIERADASPVITADGVNICTGRPMGQGSELFKVPSFRESGIQIDGGTAAAQ